MHNKWRKLLFVELEEKQGVCIAAYKADEFPELLIEKQVAERSIKLCPHWKNFSAPPPE